MIHTVAIIDDGTPENSILRALRFDSEDDAIGAGFNGVPIEFTGPLKWSALEICAINVVPHGLIGHMHPREGVRLHFISPP
jgi:hypothetical protein